jgi:hypothetical protein
MKVDFLKPDCTIVINEAEFGLCDDDNKEPAFVDITDKKKWIATVVNSAPPKEIKFTAIDNCIDIYKENGEMDTRCDAILQYDSNLLFIELKTKRADWKSGGLEQIEATIQKMIKEMPSFYYQFRKRKAVVANSKNISPAFNEFDVEQREFFKRNYKIHLQFDAKIAII